MGSVYTNHPPSSLITYVNGMIYGMICVRFRVSWTVKGPLVVIRLNCGRLNPHGQQIKCKRSRM